MSQTKKLALLCYWIIRYKPFSQKGEAAEKCYRNNKCTINELIALFIIRLDIFALPSVNRAKAEQVLYNGEVETSLTHAFMHTDMTKESMMQLLFSMKMAFKA